MLSLQTCLHEKSEAEQYKKAVRMTFLKGQEKSSNPSRKGFRKHIWNIQDVHELV